VYIGSNDGHFYVLDLAAGKKLLGFRSGRAALGFSGDRGGAGGDWLAGRARILFRGLSSAGGLAAGGPRFGQTHRRQDRRRYMVI